MHHVRMPELSEIRNLIVYEPDTGKFFSRKTGKLIGRMNYKGYLRINIHGKDYFAHRMAWYLVHEVDPLQNEIDHIDRDKTNNRICNLRCATRSEQCLNKVHPRGTSGIAGVAFRHDSWQAYIYVNRRQIHLGYFKSKIYAAIVVRRERKRRGIKCPVRPGTP